MTPDELKEKQFESDIERYLLTEGGYTKGTQATYDRVRALDLDTLIRFISTTQPKQWARYERQYGEKVKIISIPFCNQTFQSMVLYIPCAMVSMTKGINLTYAISHQHHPSILNS